MRKGLMGRGPALQWDWALKLSVPTTVYLYLQKGNFLAEWSHALQASWTDYM
ncbi:BQ2448_7127 [Microbotryum intermedium]|uniref:BQ2448_7127 protein n=1 Tax=Microbotryum intermedium TaxID=269621 RepID=A0A238FHB3_9BASI|nr:BQ2448_7127 [Microbotryum intermedium]